MTKAKNSGMVGVLDRERLITYSFCCDSIDFFAGALVEVVVNLMWTEAALLQLSTPPQISNYPTLWMDGCT